MSASSDHYFHLESPSVPKLQNQATITAGRDSGLAEWIIDDSCLVEFYVYINIRFDIFIRARKNIDVT